jgi:hypothetical protein
MIHGLLIEYLCMFIYICMTTNLCYQQQDQKQKNIIKITQYILSSPNMQKKQEMHTYS